MSMSIIDRLLALFGIKKISITLIGHEREGGYTYITSPQLPGFTFMLEPGEEENLRAIIDAIDDPLRIFLEAHLRVEESRSAPVHLTEIRHSRAKNSVAQLAYA